MGTFGFSNLFKKLRPTKFSLIIYETTDVSTLKQLVRVRSYYDIELQQTVDEKLIGLACDDASVMMEPLRGCSAFVEGDKTRSIYASLRLSLFTFVFV